MPRCSTHSRGPGSGRPEDRLKQILELQRKATWRLGFISSENSKGFHADQEAARILGESIDYSRQATALALRARSPAAPDLPEPQGEVQGVTDRAAAPPPNR